MQKKVKNGFIEVTEAMVPSTFHNPSTHEEDSVMRRQWVFTPYMLPDDAEMPRDPQAWKEEFARVGAKLQPFPAKSESEFDSIVEQCTKAIEAAYKARYEPTASPSAKALDRLGFR